MYLVKTYLDRSSIEGVGVFAGEDIPEGTVVWDLVEGFDQILDPADVKKLPERAQQYIKRYAYLARGKLYLCGDHGQFTNHSDAPNIVSLPGDSEKEIAARDIKKGEELTSDYREFDEESRGKLVFEAAAV